MLYIFTVINIFFGHAGDTILKKKMFSFIEKKLKYGKTQISMDDPIQLPLSKKN